VPPKGQFAQSTGRPCRVQRGQGEPHRMPLCLADGRSRPVARTSPRGADLRADWVAACAVFGLRRPLV